MRARGTSEMVANLADDELHPLARRLAIPILTSVTDCDDVSGRALDTQYPATGCPVQALSAGHNQAVQRAMSSRQSAASLL